MNTVRKYLITGFLFTAVLGTLAHFFYNWSGSNTLVSLFAPVNESTWEHMKLLFFPVFLWSFFIPGQLSQNNPGLRPALLLGGIIGTLLIPILFYTYSGILGYTVTWIDIAIFFICTAVSFICTFRLADSEPVQKKRTVIMIMTILFIAAFFLFTFLPPDIGLFKAPDMLSRHSAAAEFSLMNKYSTDA